MEMRQASHVTPTEVEPAPTRCRKCRTTRVHVDTDFIECMKCGDYEERGPR